MRTARRSIVAALAVAAITGLFIPRRAGLGRRARRPGLRVLGIPRRHGGRTGRPTRAETFGSTFTATATFSGSYTLPKKPSEGWIAIGAKENTTTWKKLRQGGNCKWVTLGSGTARMPWKFPYFHHPKRIG